MSGGALEGLSGRGTVGASGATEVSGDVLPFELPSDPGPVPPRDERGGCFFAVGGFVVRGSALRESSSDGPATDCAAPPAASPGRSSRRTPLAIARPPEASASTVPVATTRRAATRRPSRVGET